MIKVLFTGGGGAGNEAIWRLLKDKYELYFADADVWNINPIIPENRRFETLLANDIDFISKIGLLCQNLKIDLLIPGVDEELLILAQAKEDFLPTQLLLPDADYIETMLDKLKMIKALEEKNIKVPLTNRHNSCYDFQFPFVIKPRWGRGSKGFRIVNNYKEWDEIGFSDNLIAQEKIEGTEYTVQMITDSQANLKAIVPVKVDIKRGITIRAKTDNNFFVVEACKKIHKAIPTKGCYNIQCILTKYGEVYPFEINPRISTTFCMTLAVGIDPIDIFLNGGNDGIIYICKPIKLQRHWTNYFTEEI